MTQFKHLKMMCLCGFLLLQMELVAAKVSVHQIGIDLPKTSIENSWGGQKRVHGYDFDVKTFDIPLGVVDLTAHILKQLKHPPVLQAIPRGVLISDVKDSHHWLIRLTSLDAHRTSAVISILDWKNRTTQKISWMPKYAELVFESSAESLYAYDSTHVYQARVPLVEFQQQIYAHLLKEGWRHQELFGKGLKQSWEKSGVVLHLFFYQEDPYTRVSIFSHKE